MHKRVVEVKLTGTWVCLAACELFCQARIRAPREIDSPGPSSQTEPLGVVSVGKLQIDWWLMQAKKAREFSSYFFQFLFLYLLAHSRTIFIICTLLLPLAANFSFTYTHQRRCWDSRNSTARDDVLLLTLPLTLLKIHLLISRELQLFLPLTAFNIISIVFFFFFVQLLDGEHSSKAPNVLFSLITVLSWQRPNWTGHRHTLLHAHTKAFRHRKTSIFHQGFLPLFCFFLHHNFFFRFYCGDFALLLLLLL